MGSGSGGESVAACHETGDGEVFVNVRPMEADTAAANFNIGTLGRGGGKQARRPEQRDAEGASIGKEDVQGVVGAGGGLCQGGGGDIGAGDFSVAHISLAMPA